MIADRILTVSVTACILISFFLSCLAIINAPYSADAQAPTGPDRLDFVATEGQTVFPTSNVSPKPNVLVYRNGLLQRQGLTADYTQQYIQNGARIRITFNAQAAPEAGAYVTLFYYR